MRSSLSFRSLYTRGQSSHISCPWPSSLHLSMPPLQYSSPRPKDISLCDIITNLITFSASFIKLIDLHLPKDTTLQASHLHTKKGMSLHITFAANKSELPSEILQEVHLTSLSSLYIAVALKSALFRYPYRQLLCTSVAIITLFSIIISRNITASFPSMTHYCHKARMRKMTPITLR